MNECKDIKGYEGLYQISDNGEVRNIQTGHILRPRTRIDGRKQIILIKDKMQKSFYIHRLVATSFLENPYGYDVVNHKDENPSNNAVSNLEWCTQKYNVNYGTAIERKSHQIGQYDSEGNLIRIWQSSMDCHRAGYNQGAIWACCRNRYNAPGNRTYKGFMWKYIGREVEKANKTDMANYAFERGWSEAKKKDLPKIKDEIKDTLGLVTEAAFHARKRGAVEPKVSEARRIVEIFKKYGIPESKVWGDA